MAEERIDHTIRKKAKICDVGRRHCRLTRAKSIRLSEHIFGNLKDWTTTQARQAINLEKEFKKKLEKALAIKLPKAGMTEELVCGLHPAIENVYFLEPQGSECLVTLQESANPQAVATTLSVQKIGRRYLSVEYKENTEDDRAKAKDIDPLTLYVNNTQSKDIDKYTNAGFLKCWSFEIAHESGKPPYGYAIYENLEQAMEDFKRLYVLQMYRGNFIVRFRRLRVD